MGNDFKIQVPQYIVRNEGLSITDKSFVLLAKLIQAYYSQNTKVKSLTFEIPHKLIMQYINISENRTFKDCLDELYKLGFLTDEISTLPRKGGLTVSISKSFIPEFNNGELFTQLESEVFHKSVVGKIGHSGVRILYYIKSFINYKQLGKDHAYPSVIRMSNDLNMTEKTVIKYIKILEKVKFIKVKRHDPITESVFNENDKEVLIFKRLNNEYSIKHENIVKYIEKSKSLVV